MSNQAGIPPFFFPKRQGAFGGVFELSPLIECERNASASSTRRATRGGEMQTFAEPGVQRCNGRSA